MTERSAEFIAIAEQASEIAEKITDLDAAPLDALEEAANEIGRSWSKSNLGYQANVYYENYEVPPAGAIFSREWGFLGGVYHGTDGNWEIRQVDEVKAEIEERAGKPDLSGPKEQSEGVRPQVEELIQRARSVAAKVPTPHDDYVKPNIEQLQHIKLASESLLARQQMQGVHGQIMSRDASALEGGAQVAGHQIMLAKVRYIKSPYRVARSLATICQRLGMHLEGEGQVGKAVTQLGSKVFIGHGGASTDYLKLGVWLSDHDLDWEVFDRKPTAGMSVKERLLEMLDNAQIAFLLMTSEDETAEGKSVARANVIHEVGLFQGRLGWMKAIILLEDGCEEFSNIGG
ncbi:TIR domain-containing protein, partial [Micromonospora aurantiaca (nom. illeg.)]